MRITICFLFLLISFCSCDRKQENLIRKIESNYHGLNKFYDELDTFNDSICKIALDSAKISFSKKNFVLYSFAPNDSSWTTAQILKNTFTFSVLERPYKSDVFEFSFNEGMISEYQREFGFNPIDSMSTIYETLRKKGLVEIPERFGTRYSDLVNFYICNLEFPQDTSLRSPYPYVRVKFRVSPTGKPDSIKIIQSFSAKYDSAVVRLIKGMPNWRPRTNKGEYVPVYVILPIRFNPEEKARRCSKITS